MQINIYLRIWTRISRNAPEARLTPYQSIIQKCSGRSLFCPHPRGGPRINHVRFGKPTTWRLLEQTCYYQDEAPADGPPVTERDFRNARFANSRSYVKRSIERCREPTDMIPIRCGVVSR